MNSPLLPTRAAALAAMQAFVPAMGRRYSNGRNYDQGPGRRTSVSGLSPYIRRRLLTEQELVTAAVGAHGPEDAGKFVQEVIWRGYFKGWLEHRPQVWASYRAGLQADRRAAESDRRLAHALRRAEKGQTGLECFDAWACELVETNTLHNHARMWFASIWIFTLGLPWRLGADFFYRHLLDGDAASNTLSWRWVAGLHTRGKPYAARADNIAAFTGGRFRPRERDFAEVTVGLESSEPEGLPPLQALRGVDAPEIGRPTALVITDEDCCLEDFELRHLDIRGCATLSATYLRSTLEVAEAVTAFEAGALGDAAARVKLPTEALRAEHPRDLVEWAVGMGATQVVTPFVTRGPLHDWLQTALPLLAAQGIRLAEWQRAWDAAIWPYATAGFFKVKQQMTRILQLGHFYPPPQLGTPC